MSDHRNQEFTKFDPPIEAYLLKHPKKINTIWAEKILGLHFSHPRVEALRITNIDIGTTTRIHLEVHHNGPSHIPRKWFIKIPSLSFRARWITILPQLLQMEIRFYQDLSPLIPLLHPTSLFAGKSFWGGTTLVLEDIQENQGRAGSPMNSLNEDEVYLMVESLGKMHRKFWNRRYLEEKYDWLEGKVRRLEDMLGSFLAKPLMKRGIRKAGKIIPKELYPLAIKYAKHRKRIMAYLHAAPLTLVHHDCHPGNLFWKENQPGLLDWQLVRLGEGIGDIAYLLATCLAPSLRKKIEKDLVKTYGAVLAGPEVSQKYLEGLFERYQLHLAYPFEAMVVTLAIGGMMDTEANLELLSRSSQALLDNESLARLEHVLLK
ncbi:MAG: DUF1679 domain-containing protein [Planctomycetota bacterium]|nr:MAG: DUF1679 domain-containing protein [Planctomycetota bacterium]